MVGDVADFAGVQVDALGQRGEPLQRRRALVEIGTGIDRDLVTLAELDPALGKAEQQYDAFELQAMMSGKIDIATLSKLLGHKTLKQTMKYAHLAPTHMTKAANVMDAVFALPSSTKLTQGTESNAVEAEMVGENAL